MTQPQGDIGATMGALWSPVMAVTTRADGKDNGQIIVAALSASLIHEAPRLVVELWKANLTHDMVMRSGFFIAHLLPGEPAEASQRALPLVRALGLRSGRDGDKMGELATQPSVTGAPILSDALTYVEARVAGTLDAGEATIFLADVIAGDRLRPGLPLTMPTLQTLMTAEDRATWDAHNVRQRAIARQQRGLRPR